MSAKFHTLYCMRYGRHIDNSASHSQLRLVWDSLTLAQYIQADNKLCPRHLSDDRPIYHCPRNVNFHQALPIPLDLQESAVGYCNTSSVDLQLAVHVCCSPSVQFKQPERMVVTTAELQRNRRENWFVPCSPAQCARIS